MDIKKELNYKETYYQGHKDDIKRTNKRYYQKHRDNVNQIGTTIKKAKQLKQK